MYHGTSYGGFNSFDIYGGNFGLFGQGAYFTENPQIANEYTNKGKGNNKRVYECYLDIKNPIDMDAKADINIWEKALNEMDEISVDFRGVNTNEDAFKAVLEELEYNDYGRYEAYEFVSSLMSEHLYYDGITHIGGGRRTNSEIRHRVWIAFDATQIKSATDNIGTYDRGNADIRYSTKNVNELIENAEKASSNTGKITKDMPEEERSKIISQKRITVPAYNKDKFDVIKDFDINTLKNTYKSKAFPIIETINKYFNITNKTYSNKDIDLDFEYSKASLNESMHKQHKDYDDFAKLLSVFDDVVKNAVGIEVHDDKYKGTRREDTSLKNMYVLASAFKDGDIIVPVQLEIKNYSDRANKLYLTVTLDKNQRNSESATSLGQNQLHNGITVPSDISISDLVKSVNASNGKFLKYFPNSMLNSEQISAKQEALKADEERINQYRNGEKQKHSNKFENTIDEILQDDDIKAKKNAENGKIVVISKKTPEVILKNVSDSQDLPLIMKYLKLQRSFEKGKK